MAYSFSVTPMRHDFDLKAGETYHGYLIVANPADATEDFHFKVSVSPYSVKGTEYTSDFTTMSDRTKIKDWISLDTDRGVLKPNETKRIEFTIKVPESAPAGGQYAMIGVSSDSEPEGDSTGVVQNIYEMASLIFADVEGETKHEGRVLETKVPGFVASGKPVVSTTLINEGNVHETAKIKITVKNAFNGETVFSNDNETDGYEVTVMPETTRVVYRELAGLPALGIFNVSEDVAYLDNNAGTSGVLVICPVWFMALVFVTIASAIIMICHARASRRKRNLKFDAGAKPENQSDLK